MKPQHVFEDNINFYTNVNVTLSEIFSQRTQEKVNKIYNFPLICLFSTVMFINVVHEWVTSVKCSIYLFSTALDKRPTKHGCHPIAARDKQGFVGLNSTIIQFKHHIWDTKKEIFDAAKTDSIRILR